MDQNTLQLLEYHEILNWLSQETHSEAGRLAALALTPDSPPEEILQSWAYIAEGLEVLLQTGGPDLGEHLALYEILEPLKAEGAMLGAEELTAIAHEARAAKGAKAFFRNLDEFAPKLCALAADLEIFPELLDSIERTIGPDGDILDTASSELARLRMDQAATRHGLTSRLGDLMRSEGYRHIVQDELVTTRSERFVVPVRASAASQKRGLVHDWSKTGATAFLEPLEAVEDNNKLGLLKRREKEEIERILRRLSTLAAQAAEGLLRSGEILTQLDLIMAKSRLAKGWGAIAPEYKPGQGYNLKAAKHPLLSRKLSRRGERMTALDLVITPDQPVLVISGVNTGGKTVAMKTLGLNVLMAATGLYLPVAEGSVMDFPEEVMAIIGDEQDLGSDLSTFSGHVKSLNKVLSLAGPKALILLDEIGSGTDPSEGAALGLAVLDELTKSGAYVLAATHYQLIKTWSMLTDGVMSVAVNASESGRPVYGLSYGSPGFSGGLRMSRLLGLPEALVQKAESYLDDGQKKAMELLAKLDQERASLMEARLGYEDKTLALARAEQELKNKTRQLTEDFLKKSQKQDQEIRDVLNKTKIEFELLKKELKAASGDGRQADHIGFNIKKAALDTALRGARPQVARQEGEPLAHVAIGDEVLVKNLNKTGRVTEMTDRGEAWVSLGGLNVKVSLKNLYAPEAASGGRDKKAQAAAKVTVTAGVDPGALSLNLLGQTVDEAIDRIEKAIDQAELSGRKMISVIHGFGTGRLRQGIRGYLKNHPRVKSFDAAVNQAGGQGVTEVWLRD